MSRSLSSRLSGPLLSAVAAALVLTTTTALAGSGVGGVFNLGQVNTVNQKSTLTGATSEAELLVQNTGTGAALSLVGGAGAPPFRVNSSSKIASLNADFLDGLDSSALQKRVTGTCAAGQAIRVVNANGSVSCQAVAGAGGTWSLSGNAGTNPGANFLGTTDNKALEFKVSGQRALRLEPTATSPNLIGGFSGNAILAGAAGATIAGGGVSGISNLVSDNYGTVGGGIANVAGDQDAGNVPNSAEGAIVGGGEFNTASAFGSTVGGGFLNVASGGSSTVGGGDGNTADADYAAVSGGRNNSASFLDSTVGGGNGNTASGGLSGFGGATVAGGSGNTASGIFSAVGGGEANIVQGPDSVVGGGRTNIVNGESATIGGGQNNFVPALASGATVPGGYGNTAGGQYSFAAGRQAKANHDGTFVWADGAFGFGSDMASTGENQFIARAGGHFFLQSDSTLDNQNGFINTSTGAFLSTGGTWTNASSRSLKAGFAAISPVRVLEKVAALPVTSWHYKTEPGVRHIGPASEDFYRAFGVGDNASSIGTVDEGGVALAAIQGLIAQNRALDRKVDRLKQQNQDLRAGLQAQNARLTKLERAFAAESH